MKLSEWQALLTKVKVNDTDLVQINLGNCDINDQMAIELSSALSNNNVVKKLILVRNEIHDQGLVALANMLLVNTSIESIRLGYNYINEHTSSLFLEAVEQNERIFDLTLFDKCGNLPKNIVHIREYLNRNAGIKKKALLYKQLIKDIKTNDPLFTVLDLSLIQVESDDDFVNAINKNTTIKKIRLNPKEFSAENLHCNFKLYRYLREIEIIPVDYAPFLERVEFNIVNAVLHCKNIISVKIPKDLLFVDGKSSFSSQLHQALQTNNEIYNQYLKEVDNAINAVIIFAMNAIDQLPADILIIIIKYVISIPDKTGIKRRTDQRLTDTANLILSNVSNFNDKTNKSTNKWSMFYYRDNQAIQIFQPRELAVMKKVLI